MLDHQTIIIGSVVDIVNARMLVRQTARHLGMNLVDQSRISLATSSVADSVGLGTGRSAGEITINCLHRQSGGREGLQIVCVYAERQRESERYSPQIGLTDIKWMVDEFNVRELPDKRTEISLIKWLG